MGFLIGIGATYINSTEGVLRVLMDYFQMDWWVHTGIKN